MNAHDHLDNVNSPLRIAIKKATVGDGSGGGSEVDQGRIAVFGNYYGLFMGFGGLGWRC